MRHLPKLPLLLPLTIALCLCAGVGWGATYYVNSVNGSNANAGTSAGAAWLDLSYADDMAAAGDTVVAVAPPTQPHRNHVELLVGNATITGNGTIAYSLCARDVSNGTAVGNLFELQNPGFEGWVNATNPWQVNTYGDPLQQNATAYEGQYSALVHKDSSNPHMQWIAFLPELTEVTFSLKQQNISGTTQLKLLVLSESTHGGTGNYLQSDFSTWGSGYVISSFGSASTGLWGSSSVTFTTDNHTNNQIARYLFTVNWGSTATDVLVDDVELTMTNATITWELHSGDVWKVSGLPTAVKTLGKCTKASWTNSGATALEFVRDANLYGAYSNATNATLSNGEFLYSSSEHTLYYKLDDGEAINDLHFEAGNSHAGYVENDVGAVLGALECTGSSDNTYEDLWFGLYPHSRAVNLETSGSNVFNNVHGWGPYSNGWMIKSASNSFTDCSARYSDDGFAIFPETATDNMFVNCTSEYNQDDGFQASFNSTGTEARYCISAFNGYGPRGEQAGDNTGFSSEDLTGSTSFILKNCVAYGNSRGFDVKADDTLNATNCAAFGNVFYDMDGHANATLLSVSYSAWETATTAFNAGNSGNNNIETSTPGFVDAANGNFTLQAGSPCIDAGTDVSLTTDYAGTTVPQDGDGDGTATPDIGAYEYVRSAVADAARKAFQQFRSWGGWSGSW